MRRVGGLEDRSGRLQPVRVGQGLRALDADRRDLLVVRRQPLRGREYGSEPGLGGFTSIAI